jgi:hypothetical protein
VPRKPFDAEEKRTLRFSVYVNAREANELEKLAKNHNINPTEYLRRAALSTHVTKSVPSVSRAKWQQLGNLTGLLNQIAKGVNMGQVHNVSPTFLEELKLEVSKLRLEIFKYGTEGKPTK